MLKKFFTITILFISTAFCRDLPEDLPDYTPLFALRSIFSGDILTIDPNPVDPTNLNWRIREVRQLPKGLENRDKLKDKLPPLGYIQFLRPYDSSLCLAIGEDGLFTQKGCDDDINSGKFETVFSIIPTITDAVQIRSLVNDSDECIGIFDNPHLQGGRAYGLLPCDFDPVFSISLRVLIAIAPPYLPSKVITPK